MKNRRYRAAVALLLAGVCMYLTACEMTPAHPGSISGIVRGTGTRAPLQGAHVECDGVISITDAAGYYMLLGLGEGWRSLHVVASDHYSLTESVHVVGATRHDVFMSAIPEVTYLFGTVSHSVLGPLEGALVDVDGLIETTDENGEYEFSNLPRDSEQMSVSLDGFQTSTRQLHFDEDSELLDVDLRKLSSAVFYPTADAGVRSDLPYSNFGESETLDLFNGPTLTLAFYMLLPVEGLEETASVTACTLRLYNVRETSGDDPLPTLIGHLSSHWNEMEIVWSNRPGHTSGATHADVSYASRQYGIDITSFVDDWMTGT
ncbi:DNRLRE domain-containing protein, partial [bacterium]|nr:DNRLRE domain-containing protein [bacterium]